MRMEENEERCAGNFRAYIDGDERFVVRNDKRWEVGRLLV